MESFDVLIVGGGPAGLSAGLLLGRCRRTVLLCDTGEPRNVASRALHGFLTRDGIPPRELLRMGREEVRRYGVELRDIEVVSVRPAGGAFEAQLGDGACVRSRRVILATGMADNMPPIDGLSDLYGRSVFHCAYCDGWEARDQPLAVIAGGHAGFRYALLLTQWSRDVVLCTHGPSELTPDEMVKLTRQAIFVRQQPIAALVGQDGQLERVVFDNGDSLPRRAAFVKWGERPQSRLAQALGCRFTEEGTVDADFHGCASTKGVYVVGDASPAVQLVIVAAAQGASAATHIQSALAAEDMGLD